MMNKKLINIRGVKENNDIAYRYKMPEVDAITEGKGNGIKTNIINMVEIASALQRESYEILKYFGYIIGTNSQYTDDNKYILPGNHSSKDLQDLLCEKYIENFIICGECTNPETYYIISKGFLSCFFAGDPK